MVILNLQAIDLRHQLGVILLSSLYLYSHLVTCQGQYNLVNMIT